MTRKCATCGDTFEANQPWHVYCHELCRKRGEWKRVRKQAIPSDHLCECGCGERTSIATMSNKRWGHVAGQPMRYRVGHSPRTAHPKKRTAWDHRSADKRGLVVVTRLQAEAALGRFLDHNEFVYTIAGTLVVGRRGYSNLIRYRLAAKAATGSASSVWCQGCHAWGPREAMTRRGSTIGHPACVKAYFVEWARRRRAGIPTDLIWPAKRAANLERLSLRLDPWTITPVARGE